VERVKTALGGGPREQIRSRPPLAGSKSVPSERFRDEKRPRKRHDRRGFSGHAACHGLTRVAVSRVFG